MFGHSTVTTHQTLCPHHNRERSTRAANEYLCFRSLTKLIRSLKNRTIQHQMNSSTTQIWIRALRWSKYCIPVTTYLNNLHLCKYTLNFRLIMRTGLNFPRYVKLNNERRRRLRLCLRLRVRLLRLLCRLLLRRLRLLRRRLLITRLDGRRRPTKDVS